MSSKYKFLDQSRPYFASFAIVEWVDVFVRPNYVEILLDSLRYCQKNKGLVLYAWCVMPSHIHLIMGTTSTPMQVCDSTIPSHLIKPEKTLQYLIESLLLQIFKTGRARPNTLNKLLH